VSAQRLLTVAALAALLALGCSQQESARDAADDAAADAEKPDPQRLTGAVSQLSGTAAAVAGEKSPLQGLVDALGGEVRGSEIFVALPADTLFAFDQADVLPAAADNLRKLAELIGETEGTVQLNGYTDAKGEDGYNLALSKRRADAVKAWLASSGVPEARLQANGFGAANPIAPNQRPDGSDDTDGRAKNRRVEAVIPNAAGAASTGDAPQAAPSAS
jgi:outer membrane protein OmpA-like peptidoglycan-associated protein